MVADTDLAKRLYCYLPQSDDVRKFLRSVGSGEPMTLMNMLTSETYKYPEDSIFLYFLHHPERMPPKLWGRLVSQKVVTVAIDNRTWS